MRRHPIAVAELLQLRSAARRVGLWRVCALLALIAVVLAVAVTVFGSELQQAAVHAGRWIDKYSLLLAALAAVNSALLVSRSKQRRIQMQQSSWLAAAPIEASAVRMWIFLRVAIAAGSVLAVVIALLISIQAIAGSDAELLPATVFIAAGFIAGSVAGSFLRPRQHSGHAASRYVPRSRAASSEALSRWPIAQAISWHRPENARFVLAAALLAVQGGSSIVVGLGVVGFWLLGTYLVVLLHATFVVGREAANWLRATPISFARFAWPLARRMVVHQGIGSLAAAGVGMLLGASPLMMVYLVALWMTVIIAATLVSLADSYRHRHAPLKWTLLAAVAALAELRQRGSGIAFALVVTVAHIVLALRPTGESNDPRA